MRQKIGSASDPTRAIASKDFFTWAGKSSASVRAGIGGDQAGGHDPSVMGWIGRAAEGLPSPLGRYF